MRFWTVNELLQGKGMTAGMIQRYCSDAATRRAEHREANRGWTRSKSLRSEMIIPKWLYLQPEIMKRYFPEEADNYEKAKALEQFKRDFPKLRSHD